MSAAGRDRRQHKRVALNLPAHIATIEPERDDTGHPFFRISDGSFCLNISSGGAFLYSEHSIATGTRVLIGLDLPGHGEFDIIGRVVRRHPLSGSDQSYDGLAVEFMTSAEKELGFISDAQIYNLGVQNGNAVGF